MKSILIIDDAKVVAEMTALMLEKSGYKVYRAYSGRTGIEMATALVPDLILLDIMMPEISGWEVLDELRSNEKTKDIHILFFSAKVDDEEKSKDVDVDGFIAKPFDEDAIVEKIKKILGE